MYLKVVVDFQLMMREDAAPVEAAKRCVVDASIQMANLLGHSDAAGALIGSLFVADGPLSMDELVEMTGYSKSTVSINMTFLENQGIVRRMRRPGDKRNYYVIMKNIDETLKTENEKIRQMMQIQIAAIGEAERILEGAIESDEAERLRRLFSTTRVECVKARKLIDLVAPFTIDELIEILEREVAIREAGER
ncbi:MAG: putative HTH-type transcriptional regulator [Methanosaeta sp. PtaU1.Bin055]|nr:MAG: putative HTH-type transcriptional regulator [Methanosaeta sp. PtaU1.Bin055]